MKIINWIKSHYFNILLFTTILFIISPVILSKPLNNLDEVWNYNFAYNIANGLVPYRDFNMLQTPLLPFIVSIFFLLFGNELLVFRILAIFLISILFYMIYKIFKKLKINLSYIFIFMLLLFLLLQDYICIDYNFALLIITFILIYFSIQNNDQKNKSFLYYFNIGILSGFCILLKQSTGAIISFISVFYPALFIKHKSDIKIYLKNSFITILGIALLISILLIYLMTHNALKDFIDYTILGIKTFTNSIPYTYLLNSNNVIIKLLSTFIPIAIVISGFYLIIKKKQKLLGFYCYSIGSLVVIFPISDNIHFLIGITPFLVLFFYLLFCFISWLKNKILINLKIKSFIKETLKSIINLSLVCYLIASLILLGNYVIDSRKNHNISHYLQIPISEQLLNKINTIDSYILMQNTPVYILDAEAAIYMIPINRYYKDFNLFLKGNLGSLGENGQIEKIKNLKSGSQILIKNDNYTRNWQTPEYVISYIKNNLNKIGEISIFDIYEKE
ncbi:MAG: hypothetical protein HFJ28_05805 [Clostridia bacterium]|nr:hypothetical protein [Clostridia bacterium]